MFVWAHVCVCVSAIENSYFHSGLHSTAGVLQLPCSRIKGWMSGQLWKDKLASQYEADDLRVRMCEAVGNMTGLNG